MKTIKFKNSNGVEVSYDQAATIFRIIAFLIDVLVYAISFWIIRAFLGYVAGESQILTEGT